MGLLDSLLGDSAGKTPAGGGTEAALVGVLSTVLAQNGGVQGLMNKFSQGGLGGIFSSWVGTGENQPVSASQVQNAPAPSRFRRWPRRSASIPRWHRG